MASVLVVPAELVFVTVEIVLKYVAEAPPDVVQLWPLLVLRYQACEAIVKTVPPAVTL